MVCLASKKLTNYMRILMSMNLRWFNRDPDMAVKNQTKPVVQVDT